MNRSTVTVISSPIYVTEVSEESMTSSAKTKMEDIRKYINMRRITSLLGMFEANDKFA